MSIINLSKLTASNLIQGFGYKTNTNGTLSVNSFSLAAGALHNESVTVAVPVTNAASLTMVRYTGVGNSTVNGVWMTLPGQNFFRCTSPNYDIVSQLSRSAGFQTITIQYHNATGAGVTVPAHTVDWKSIFFDAPW